MPHGEIDKGKYIEVVFREDKVPASGSNGFFFRKNVFDEVKNDPFVHPTFVHDLVKKGHTKMAKVKQGLIHVQDGSIKTFFRKKLRRINRRYKGEVKWGYNYDLSKKDIINQSLYMASIIMPLKDAFIGFRRRPSFVWFFHPVATLGLCFIYGYYSIRGLKY